ncbi:hypothetical protein LG275_03735 [Chryseomicrobium palamuruense]
MSLFGYPATILHKSAQPDDWGRVVLFDDNVRKCKVIEEQKLIRNSKGEEVQSAYEIHLEGNIPITFQDVFVYRQYEEQEITLRPLHILKRKNLGTDITKKVIIYG